jgi:hypothetical protein
LLEAQQFQWCTNSLCKEHNKRDQSQHKAAQLGDMGTLLTSGAFCCVFTGNVRVGGGGAENHLHNTSCV